jgi:N-acetyl-alpha-D-glucosaminyl L-malate synthase BshA
VKIGVTCFSTFGGSGQVASELALGLADRGHQLHVIARELPVRLRRVERASPPNITFHEVIESDYPALATSGAYPIALASKMIEVAQQHSLDLFHVHYAVPHATAGWMAREVLGEAAPRLVVTLHGTDITLVGAAPNHLAITRHSIEQCDAVTTPSASLREATFRLLGVRESLEIEVIPNFVDTARFTPGGAPSELAALFPRAAPGPVLVHVSNFRPVKRLADVVAIFAAVHQRLPCRLLLIGDGPERAAAERAVDASGLRAQVAFTGMHEEFAPLLAAADLFLLPSAEESFGLAALEAMACGVPVVASDAGGLPEVVEHGRTGYLAPVGEVAAMAAHAVSILQDRARAKVMGEAARARAVQQFSAGPAIDAYEALYRKVTSFPSTRRAPSPRRP